MADQAVLTVAVETVKYASKTGVLPFPADRVARVAMVVAAVATFVTKVFLWGLTR